VASVADMHLCPGGSHCFSVFFDKMSIDSAGLASKFPPELQPEAGAFIDYLLALRGHELTILLNKGNRGDGLIHRGAFRLFDTIGLTYRPIRFPERASGAHLLAFGSGCFSRYFNHMVSYLNLYRVGFQRVTILPATFDLSIRRVRRFIRSLEQEKFTIFCRDKVSAASIKGLRPELEDVHVAHDLAFYCDVEPWLRRGKGRGTLLVARTDEETSNPIEIEADRIADSSAGSDDEPQALLDEIAPFHTVHTDRLHAAVASVLLKKQVHLYEGNYFKNRAVFEFTLVRFPGASIVPRPSNLTNRRPVRRASWPILRSRLRLRLIALLRPALYRWRFWRSNM
jgi:hypothetical protein